MLELSIYALEFLGKSLIFLLGAGVCLFLIKFILIVPLTFKVILLGVIAVVCGAVLYLWCDKELRKELDRH